MATARRPAVVAAVVVVADIDVADDVVGAGLPPCVSRPTWQPRAGRRAGPARRIGGTPNTASSDTEYGEMFAQRSINSKRISPIAVTPR